jgi:hypothetical protein
MAAAIASTGLARRIKTNSTERKIMPPSPFQSDLNMRDWPFKIDHPLTTDHGV